MPWLTPLLTLASVSRGVGEPAVAPDTPSDLIPPGFEGKSFMGFLFFGLVPV